MKNKKITVVIMALVFLLAALLIIYLIGGFSPYPELPYDFYI